MQKPYNFLMAKSSPDTNQLWLQLWMHLQDTAGIMKKLVTKWVPNAVIKASGMDSDQFISVSVFLAAVHDIGKATSHFQSIITKSCPEKYEELIANGFVVNSGEAKKHAYMGQWILQSDTNTFKMNEQIALIVGAHHGKPSSNVAVIGEPDLIKVYPTNFFGIGYDNETRQVWKTVWREIVDNALEMANIKSVEVFPTITIEAQVLLSGLLIIADWIASNTTYFPLISLDEYGEKEQYPKRVNEGWEKLKFPNNWYSEIHYMDNSIFEERFVFLPNEIQEAMLEIVNSCENPGIFVMEAQMGIGKTEAALAAAEVLAAKKDEGGYLFWTSYTGNQQCIV